jgi:predicted site-specific integrase-resolvase
MNKLITIKEAAAQSGVSPITINTYIRKGKVKAAMLAGTYIMEESAVASIRTLRDTNLEKRKLGVPRARRKVLTNNTLKKQLSAVNTQLKEISTRLGKLEAVWGTH